MRTLWRGSTARRGAAAATIAVTLGLALALVGRLDAEPEAGPEPEAEVEAPPGFWIPAPRAPAGSEAEREADRIARLQAIGYLSGGDVAQPGRGVGVTRIDDGHSPSPRLYVSGHAPEATLISPEGEIVHRWHFDPKRIWSDVPEERSRAMDHFRRAYVLPGGALLAIVEGVGVLKLGRDSDLLWARRNGAHHAADPQPDGRIFLLTRSAHVVPEIDPEQPILEDFVVVVDAEGRELQRVSLVDALLRSDYADLAYQPHPQLPPQNRVNVEAGDVFHTNSIQVLRADPPEGGPLRAGQVLVSSLHLSAVMALDLDTRRVVWLLRDDFLVQHEAQILANGHLLLFDNNTRERGSRAVEMTLSGELLWQYPPEDAEPAERIYSGCCSTVQRLPNENTLIAITSAGRAIEVTPGHEIVWEFRTPHRVAAPGGSRDLIAALFALTVPRRPSALAGLEP